MMLKNSSMRVRGILFDSVRSAGQVFWQWASTISEREIRGSREGPTKEPERVGETRRERHWRRMENLSSRTEPSLLGPSLKRLKEGLQDSVPRTLVYSYEHDGRCRPSRTHTSNRIEIISRCKLKVQCSNGAKSHWKFIPLIRKSIFSNCQKIKLNCSTENLFLKSSFFQIYQFA